MKITGPGQPPTPVADDAGKPLKPEGAGSVAASEAAKETTTATGAAGRTPAEIGKSFAETVAANAKATTTGAAPPAQTAGSGAVAPPGAVAVHDLAADLGAGKLDARAAVDKLVDRVLASHLGAQAPAGVRDQVRDALESALESDPFLTDKLRQLGD